MNFQEKVYILIKQIPRGKVSTYKEIGNKLNSKAYRAVGSALNKNQDKSVPCHRVINSNGFVGNFNKGIIEKIKLLTKEGIKINNRQIDLKRYIYK